MVADIGEFDLILEKQWLDNVALIIHWDTDYLTHSSSYNLSSSFDISLLNAQEFENHCCEKDSYLFLISIVDYSNSDDILLGVEEATQISQEYFNLAEVFSEYSAHKLPAHRSHDLSIETTSDSPFGLLYNLRLITTMYVAL